MILATSGCSKSLLQTSFLIGAMSVTPYYASADNLSVVFVQESGNRALQLGLTASYEVVATELERVLRLQNIDVLNVATTAPSSSETAFMLFQDQSYGGQDYGIIYSISPEISENSVARLLTVRASGDVYEIRTGKVVTTFRVDAPETVPLPKDHATCNNSCIEGEIVNLSNNLARELSFVLMQKLHFLREDQVRVDASDSDAITERLIASEDQPQFLKTITSGVGEYMVDQARAMDVDVYFDFDSATLTENAKLQINPLGEALASTALNQSRYLVAGHTDARGSEIHNRELSERRAEAVRQYLLQQFSIEPERLAAVGLGEDYLRTPVEPNAAINRRVEIAAIIVGPNRGQPTADTHNYTMTFDLLPRDIVLAAVRQLEMSEVDEIELLNSSMTQRAYSVRSHLALMNFEEQVMLALMDQGLDLARLRFSITESRLSIEKID
jgi:outer membrane protein OmpA-like peptidoglycan-associated protein